MVSKQLQRLRSVQSDLAETYNSFQQPGAQLRGSLRAYGGQDKYARKELERHVSLRQEQIAALRQQVSSDVAMIKSRTISKVAAGEASKTDIRYMLDRGATVHQVSQWIVAQKREDGFAALREVVGQQAYSQQNEHSGSRSPAEQVADAEKFIEQWERQMMTPEQLAAVEELREVEASINYLNRNLDQVESYFANNLSEQGMMGNLQPVGKLSKWPGLPSQNLLADGVSIELASVQ